MYVDPQTTTRVLDLADYLVRIGAGLGAVWAVVTKIGKPAYAFRAKMLERRDTELAGKIRSILDPELQNLDRLSTCTEQLETVLRRQREVFNDLDSVLHIVGDNRDRIDEMNELLDAIGFSSDRRARENADRRAEFDTMLALLRDRQKSRVRGDDEVSLVIDVAGSQ